jgi:hypothetical protein
MVKKFPGGLTNSKLTFANIRLLEDEDKDLHQHVITEPASNNRVMHHRLIGLILEIAVPSRPEMWSWPTIHLLEFFLGWSDLDTGIDAVGGEGPCSFEVPFIEDSLLDFWNTACEVVETFSPGFRTVDWRDLV